ncbi:MAG: hypothetical protein HYS63_05550 [Methylocystis sp.]|nr:hypothetical protein [Methylocystis sp.]
MFTSIRCIAAGVLCASLSFGAALAEPKTPAPAGNAPTTWAPPAEIAPKAAPAEAPAPVSAAPAAAAQPAPSAPAAKTHAERDKDCRAQADAKGLHGKERKQFKLECLKG